MTRVLILYPEAFKSYSKFYRKVEKILSNIEEVTIVYPHDLNGYISKVAQELPMIVDSVEKLNWSEGDITHGIVFDDGEEFGGEVSELSSQNIPLRVIHIKITRVINIKKEPIHQEQGDSTIYQYIGRGSYWGNPYSMLDGHGDRNEVIRKFKYDFDFEKFPNLDKNKVYELAGKRLGCFCKPEACHGDVLADYLNSWDDGK
ncbi:DUF4326 domain-containing protein [Vibrio crassostreae]|uniref:DUF4326 domain-containing protein n=1 Tax=Vibrio crassostreae TaxID=246167 RepID=UPI00200A4B82|nr:DUF4326 domain-containing protein [Vibrio crassostreae]UPR31029.1 DUF4326 domain-containing protein [Vibrio crassostreae]